MRCGCYNSISQPLTLTGVILIPLQPVLREVSVQDTAVLRMIVGKSARDNPERYCGWFWVHCLSKKFERMAREAMDVCLWVLKESNKSRFDSYSVRNSVLLISLITFRDCHVHIFSDNLSRNSCICRPYTESKKMPGWSSWCPFTCKGGVCITASQTKDSGVTGTNSSAFKKGVQFLNYCCLLWVTVLTVFTMRLFPNLLP